MVFIAAPFGCLKKGQAAGRPAAVWALDRRLPQRCQAEKIPGFDEKRIVFRAMRETVSRYRKKAKACARLSDAPA
jgi:hypothetical protein